MTVTSLLAAVAPRTCKIINNSLGVFERGKNLLYNMVNYTLCLG